MTTQEFVSNLRRRIKADSTLFSNTDLAALMNLARLTVDAYIVKSNPALYNMLFSADLVANTREYKLSHTTRHIFQVQAYLDSKWVTIMPANYTVEYQLGDDEDVIKSKFGNGYGRAKYWKNGQFIFLLTGEITSITDGLKIYGNGRPKNVTADDLSENTRDLAEYLPTPDFTPGIPLECQYPWLVLCSRFYKLEADREATLDPEEKAVYDLLGLAANQIKDNIPVYQDTSLLNNERAKTDFGYDY